MSRIIPSESARERIHSILPTSTRMTTVITASPGAGKSTTIACGIAAMLHAEDGQRVTLCVQHDQRDVDRHNGYIRSPRFAQGALQTVGPRPFVIEYMTYGRLFDKFQSMYEDVGRLRDLYHAIILDDVHTRSMDQELASALLLGNMPAVLMTSYGNAGFNLDWPVCDLDDVLQARQPPIRQVYSTPVPPQSYEDWALQTAMQAFASNREAVVLAFLFAPETMPSFERSFRETVKDTPCLPISPGADIDVINHTRGGKLIIGVADFRSRWPIRGVTCVISAAYRRLLALDTDVAKDIPMRFALGQSELDFLRAHATTAGSTVHIWMDQRTADSLQVQSTPDWIHRTPCEYYLRVIGFFPEAILDPSSPRCPPLQFFHVRKLMDWAIYQLCYLNLVKRCIGVADGFRLTKRGSFVLRGIVTLGIDLSSAIYITRVGGYLRARTLPQVAMGASILHCLPPGIQPIGKTMHEQGKKELLDLFPQIRIPFPFRAIPLAACGDMWAYFLARLHQDTGLTSNMTNWTEAARSTTALTAAYNVAKATFTDGFSMPDGPEDIATVQSALGDPGRESLVVPIWESLCNTWLFNLAYVQELSGTSWTIKDLCSGRTVTLDEECLLDVPLLLRTHKAVYIGSPGFYLVYKEIRLLPDGGYCISNVSFMPANVVRDIEIVPDIGLAHLGLILSSPFKES